MLNIAGHRDNNLDFLRFVAASLVIFSHSYAITGQGQYEPFGILSRGQWSLAGVAVAVFFMISGYLVTQSAIHSEVANFVKKRFLRIFPGLAVAVAFTALIIGPIVTSLPLREYFSDPITFSYLKNAYLFPVQFELPGVFTNNLYPGSVNGSLWTMPYEVVCYIVLGFLAFYGLIGRERTVLTLFFTVLLLKVLSPDSILNQARMGVMLRDLLVFMQYFMAGAVYYRYRDKIPTKLSLFILSLLLLAFGMHFGNLKFLFSIFGTYAIFYFAFHKNIKLYGFAKYGDFSYGMYIYAFPIQQIVSFYYASDNPLVNGLISYPIILVLAILSWYGVERRFLKRNINSTDKKKRYPSATASNI